MTPVAFVDGAPAHALLPRLLSKVLCAPGSHCWEWLAARNEFGYGKVKTGNRRTRLAHRVAFELLKGPIPDGLELDHLCRNRGCVNPAHLEPVTHHQNVLRGEVANRTHCPHGHEYTPANTYHLRGARYCRACKRRRDREYSLRRAA